MNYFCPRKRRHPDQFVWNKPSTRPFYQNRNHEPHSTMPVAVAHGIPASPPPPYEMLDTNYPATPQPSPFYQQPVQSKQHLQPDPPNTLRKKRSAWASTSNLAYRRDQQPRRPEPGWRSTSNLPTPAGVSGFAECPVARTMNQSAALCDRFAARLNNILVRQDYEESGGEDIEAWLQSVMIDEIEGHNERALERPDDHDRTPNSQPKIGIVNFRKTWLYSNSRLPPKMMPFKVYIPTWQILCRAADASAAVYRRPKSNEKEEYIDADWRNGTKAMVLKSVAVDEKNLIVFAIRGSKWNLVDWAVNFRPAPTEPVGFLDDDGNACHAGFLQVARAMVQPVAARLRQLLEQDPSRAGSSLVITGHSAGGAVASLLYMHMLSTRVESELNILTGCFKRVHCVTFGAPPVSLLPLQKPNTEWHKKSVFVSFVNEGDPIVRADKQYIYSLGRLMAAPAPSVDTPSPGQVLRQKVSRQRLKEPDARGARLGKTAPVWLVPEATLSNAGRMALLRTRPDSRNAMEAVGVTDEQLRGVIFGDPATHEMALYKRRVDDLAFAAITGREEG